VRYVWLGLLVAISCGSGEDGERAPAAPDTLGGSSSTGGNKSPAMHGSNEAGAGGELVEAQGGAGPEAGGEGGGGITYEPDEPPMFEPGVCDPAMVPDEDEPQTLGVSDVQLLALTPDELSIAFLAGSVLYVADRSATDEPFAESAVTLPAGFEAVSGVSLSSDGQRLILVKEDHTGFGELIRATRADAFGAEADEMRFAYLNMLSMTVGRKVGWPVVSSDGETLYYVTYPGHSLVVQSSADDDGVFQLGVEIDEFTLGGPEGEYKYLRGISADERAIFFDDEATGHAVALFRQYEDAPFYDPVDLGERGGAVPNEACTRLYSSLDGALTLQTIE
jgi:hypothetical protein